MPEVTINAGVAKIALSADEVAGIKSRFAPTGLFHGSCLIIGRQTGLALDATTDAKPGTHPVLWPPHAAPWQQWHIHSAGRGRVRIVSDHSGLTLTVNSEPHDWSEVWLDEAGREHQTWKLSHTEDRVASLIEHGRRPFALDTGENVGRMTQPHIWSTHWASWQQWIICRLPLR